jgi:uncharacterized protein (DUF433 family)
MTIPTQIVSDPLVCGGDPCIKGTRIQVHVILSHLAAGDTEQTLLKHFPRLSRDDIQTCLVYAAHLATEKSAPA